MTRGFRQLLGGIMAMVILSACDDQNNPVSPYPDISREDKIPADVAKRGPETDPHPPVLHSTDYNEPVPLPYPVNTAGVEDSPFILPDGNTLYFFFTPDVRVPAEQQVLDEVSGIWRTRRQNTTWSEPERVWLQDPGKLALDGAVCIQGTEMWFASVREGYTGVNMFIAEWVDNRWTQWRYVGDRLMNEIQIGEVHLHGDDLYFHSNREGGKGNLDIWKTSRDGEGYSDPVAIREVNSTTSDGFPFVSSDGTEFWFTRTTDGTPGLYRSLKNGGSWSSPELIVSRFAGEPTLDDTGALYFTHPYYEDGVMIEADIYIATKK